MTRTLSVAGTLAILILAMWIGQIAKVNTPALGAAPAGDLPVVVAAASTDIAATAAEDLAGWPIAASR